jgi:hypothetical protein
MLSVMGAPLLGKHVAFLRGASPSVIAVAAAGSFGGLLAAVLNGAPLWLFTLAALAPWVPVFVFELVWTYCHYRWLALFCVLIITQSAYLLEQVARMTQVHLLNAAPVAASGIFSVLDMDRIPLLWTTWAALGALLLAARFPRNTFLWAALLVALIDAADVHVRFSTWIGVPRLDSAFAFSILGIVALNLAFARQLGQTYDAWLARALPGVSERVLIAASARGDEVVLRPGERLVPRPASLYVVTRGAGVLVREGPGGHEILLHVLAPGELVDLTGTVRAHSTLELLVIPAAAV